MFIKVNATVGFNPDAVAYWRFAMVPPAPETLREEQDRGAVAPPPREPERTSLEDAVESHLGPPVLSALSPAQAALGDPSFTLSVQGSNFDDGAVIVWNGSDEATTFVSATEVTTEVDMATATTATAIPVQVKNLDLALSNTLQFQLVDAPTPPADVPTLTITFNNGSELVFEGADAEKVRDYYNIPSSHLTVL
jgi:IPT/TIG domain